MKYLATKKQVFVTTLQVEATQYFTKIVILPQKFPPCMIKGHQY